MAIIQCPECGKEISSYAPACPSCGFPITAADITNTNSSCIPAPGANSPARNTPMLVPPPRRTNGGTRPRYKRRKKRSGLALLAAFLVVLSIATISVLLTLKNKSDAYDQATRYFRQGNYEAAISVLNDLRGYKDASELADYCEAVSYCQIGDYESAFETLNKIPDYDKTPDLLINIYYETRLFEGLNDFKEYLKNPDSMSVNSVDLYYYQTPEIDANPLISEPCFVATISAQNGFGGFASSYVVLDFDEELGAYKRIGSCDSLDSDAYESDGIDGLVEYFTAILIQKYIREADTINDAVNIDRVQSIVSAGGYSSIKRIPALTFEMISSALMPTDTSSSTAETSPIVQLSETLDTPNSETLDSEVVSASDVQYVEVAETQQSRAVETATGTTLGQSNALRSAQSYLEFSAFSYEGLIDQLEYEQYSHEDSVFAADNCGADWYEQALNSALSYLEYCAFSYTGLIEQLEYEKFTTDQANYAANNCNADWNEQAAKSAESYLEFLSFSRDGLIEQLEYDGFTHTQAVYGVEANGY